MHVRENIGKDMKWNNVYYFKQCTCCVTYDFQVLLFIVIVIVYDFM